MLYVYVYVVYFVMYDSVLILLLSYGHHDWFNKVFLFLFFLFEVNCSRLSEGSYTWKSFLFRNWKWKLSLVKRKRGYHRRSNIIIILILHTDIQALWEWGSAGTSVRGPEIQEGARESLKGPIASAIDVSFWFVLLFLYFQLFLVYLEK